MEITIYYSKRPRSDNWRGKDIDDKNTFRYDRGIIVWNVLR